MHRRRLAILAIALLLFQFSGGAFYAHQVLHHHVGALSHAADGAPEQSAEVSIRDHDPGCGSPQAGRQNCQLCHILTAAGKAVPGEQASVGAADMPAPVLVVSDQHRPALAAAGSINPRAPPLA